MDLEDCPFRFTPKVCVLYVESDLLIDALLNVSKDWLFDKIEGIVIHFDSGHTHH